MADKRSFTKKITESDAFLDLPLSSQCLYFHLCMNTDDDGFVNSPKRVMRIVGASDDDLKLLIMKSFVLTFESGVIVIKHFRMHNTLKNDRYHPTSYQEEFKMLGLKENGSYTWQPNGNQLETEWNQDGTKLETEHNITKHNITEHNITKYIAPSSNESEAVAKLPLNENGTYHYVLPSDVEHYRELYPGVDVEQELRNMTGWLEANRERRKTKRGVQKFINNWLSKAQNRAKGSPQKKGDLFYFDVD